MAWAVAVGTGTTVTHSGWTGTILSVSLTGPTVPVVDVTHLATATAREFIAGDLYDAGEVTMQVQHDGTQWPTLGGTASAIVFNFGSVAEVGTSGKWTGTAIMTGYNDISVADEEVMTASVTFKMTSTVAAASA